MPAAANGPDGSPTAAAGAIHPVSTERTVASRVNEERLRLIAREAAEQCGRLDVPAIGPIRPLGVLLDAWRGGTIAVGIERAPAGTRRLGRGDGEPAPPAALLVGPEGGFSPAELDVLRAWPFIQPVSLGALVLRAETAVAAGLALLGAEREPSVGAAS